MKLSDYIPFEQTCIGVVKVEGRDHYIAFYADDIDYDWKEDHEYPPFDTQIVWQPDTGLINFLFLLKRHFEANSNDDHSQFSFTVPTRKKSGPKWMKTWFNRSTIQALLDEGELVEIPNRWNRAHTVIVRARS